MTIKSKHTGLGLALGAALGAVAGVLAGHVGLWLAIGVAIGMLLGVRFGSSATTAHSARSFTEPTKQWPGGSYGNDI